MRQVDYWALGVVLYQFLVGETPFNAERIQMVYAKILAGEGLQPAMQPASPARAEAAIPRGGGCDPTC